ncbi:unnamed protein product, partial [Brassica oleracea]
ILWRFRARVSRMISAAPPDSPGSQERVVGAKEVVDEGSTVGKSDLAAVSKKEVPSWVDVAHDKKILKKYDVEGLSCITSAVGFPDRLHPETVACTNLEVAKVFAKVDISKPLPKEINFTRNGKEFLVGFHFPWLPSRCKLCDKWGHTTEVCVLQGKEVNLPPKDTAKGAEVSLKPPHTHNSDVEVQVENLEISKGDEILEVEETQQEEQNADTEDNEVGGERNWALVSPTKVGRSPVRTPCQLEDLHIFVSKFAVLSVEEEQEEGDISEKGQVLPVVSIPDSERGMVRNVEGLAQQSQADQECEAKETCAKHKQSKLPKFIPMVKEYCDSTEKLFLSTSAMYRFSKKLKNLKPLIRELGREKL